MEQKLALLRQQKQEQLAYQQSLQHRRLENMHVRGEGGGEGMKSKGEGVRLVKREAVRQQKQALLVY